MKKEKWIPVKGYEGYYEISNKRNIKSVDRINKEICHHGGYRMVMHKGKEIKQRENNKGYYYVILSKDGVVSRKYVHRLIAENFIPNPENKPEVDHIDGNTKNNEISNLRWATHKENLNNPVAKKRCSDKLKGKPKFKLAKTVYQYTIDGNFVKEWVSIAECERNGYSRTSVWKCCNNKQSTYKGYIFRYTKMGLTSPS